MTPPITIRVLIDGVESTRTLAVVQHMRGVSVVDPEHGDHCATDVLSALGELCQMRGRELVGYVAAKGGDR